eukprot:158360_1
MSEQDNLPLHLNVDLDSVPNQIGNAILRASNGSIVKSPNRSISERDLNILYKMLLEMGHILNDKNSSSSNPLGELLTKITVQGGNGVSFCVGLSTDGLVYIAKKRIDV